MSVAVAGEPDAVLLSRGDALDAVLTAVRKAGHRLDAAEALSSASTPSRELVAAETAYDAATAAWLTLRDQIEAIPARSVAGLAIKIRACNGDPELDPDMMASIAADILAMDGGAT